MSEMMWKKMYMTLLDGIVEAEGMVLLQPESIRVRDRLHRAMLEAEEIYITSADETAEE